MSTKKGLGRGFESLIPMDLLDDDFDPTAKQDEKVSQLREVALKNIHADPDQPRRSFDIDALNELAESIKEHGILQPIIVTADGNDYQIVAGERRFRAAGIAGLNTVPVIVRSLTNQHKLELSLIENLQRRDLNAIETATAYLKLRDQFNLSQDEIAKRVNKSPSAVNNTMRLLRLPKSAQTAIAEGTLTEGQARPLAGQDEAFVEEILPRIIAEEWSSRKVEQYMVNIKNLRKEKAPKTEAAESQHEAKVISLRDRLKTDVDIRVNGHGAGRIIIKFQNDKDLERLQKLLGD
ncbi:MAG: Chromosome partitioning protein ParB [Candidatus Saccharibacteria bacterium]|nr:Chromosome partitioning protein ParB [Candidatus Saccharibacteria bacterium]